MIPGMLVPNFTGAQYGNRRVLMRPAGYGVEFQFQNAGRLVDVRLSWWGAASIWHLLNDSPLVWAMNNAGFAAENQRVWVGL